MGLKLKLVGTTWHVSGTIMGKQVRRSLGVPREHRAAAETARLVIEQQILASRGLAESLCSWDEAADAYINQPGGVSKGSEEYVLRLSRYFGGKILKEITQAEVTAYVRTHLHGRKPSTVRRTVTMIQAVVNYAHRMGLHDTPVKYAKPSEGEPRDVWLKASEIRKLVAACEGDLAYMRPLVVFLLNTGARLGEAMALTWDDVNEQGAVLTTKKGKSVRRRTVPLNKAARAAMEECPYKTGHVFRTSRGRPWSRQHSSGARIYHVWKEIVDRAGVRSDLRPHDLRHTFATQLRLKGVDVATIGELLGHRSMAMTMRYASSNAAHLASAVSRMPT